MPQTSFSTTLQCSWNYFSCSVHESALTISEVVNSFITLMILATTPNLLKLQVEPHNFLDSICYVLVIAWLETSPTSQGCCRGLPSHKSILGLTTSNSLTRFLQYMQNGKSSSKPSQHASNNLYQLLAVHINIPTIHSVHVSENLYACASPYPQGR